MNSEIISDLKARKEKLLTEKDLASDLLKSSRVMGKAITISGKFKTDFFKYGEAVYPRSIGEDELLARYVFFGTIIGLIDGRLGHIRPQLKENYGENIQEFQMLNELKKKIILDSENLKINFKQIEQESDSEIYSGLSLSILLGDRDYRLKDELESIYEYAKSKCDKVDVIKMYNLYNRLYNKLYVKSLEENNKYAEETRNRRI